MPLEPRESLYLRVRHGEDHLRTLLHDRALGDDLERRFLLRHRLDVRDVVAAGDVELALQLSADRGLAAGGGRVVDRQAFAGEQALVQRDEEASRVHGGYHGHVERGLLWRAERHGGATAAAAGGTARRHRRDSRRRACRTEPLTQQWPTPYISTLPAAHARAA